MVGRLVEEQHVGVLEQELSKLDTHAPASRELGGGLGKVGALETEAQQGLLHILFEVGHVDGIELLAQHGNLLDEGHILVALIVGAGGQLIVHALNLGFGLVQMGKGLRGLLEDGAPILSHEMLGEVGDNAIFRCRHLAARGLAHSGEYLEQGALAGAVLAHQGDTVFLVNLKGYVLEQCSAAKLYGQSVY